MSIFKFTTYSGKTCQVNGSQYLEDFTETASNVLTSSDWISEKIETIEVMDDTEKLQYTLHHCNITVKSYLISLNFFEKYLTLFDDYVKFQKKASEYKGSYMNEDYLIIYNSIDEFFEYELDDYPFRDDKEVDIYFDFYYKKIYNLEYMRKELLAAENTYQASNGVFFIILEI